MKKSKIKRPVIILLLAAFVYSSGNSLNKNTRNNPSNTEMEPRTGAGNATTNQDSESIDAQAPANSDK